MSGFPMSMNWDWPVSATVVGHDVSEANARARIMVSSARQNADVMIARLRSELGLVVQAHEVRRATVANERPRCVQDQWDIVAPREQAAESQAVGEEQALAFDLSKLEGDDEECADDANQCKICMVNRANVLFMPCTHVLSCVACARALETQECPICKQPIASATRVRFVN